MRVSKKNLDVLADELNTLLGLPIAAWTQRGEQPPTANIGHIYVEKNGPLHNLYQIIGPGGGVQAVGRVYGLKAEDCWKALRIALDVAQQAKSVMAQALTVLADHASETYPHFESERGQRDIAAARAALGGAA